MYTNSKEIQNSEYFWKYADPCHSYLAPFRILQNNTLVFLKRCRFVGTFQNLKKMFFRIKICVAHEFVAQRQLNFIFIVRGDVTRALLTEFLMYDNAIAFSISIYKYLCVFNTFIEHQQRVYLTRNGNKCGKGRHVQWIRAMQCVSNTLLKRTFLSFCRFAIRVIG